LSLKQADMKTKAINKAKVTIQNRKAWGRLDEKTKEKIVKELQGGLIGQREASRKYGIPRNTMVAWMGKLNLVTLLNAQTSKNVPEMTEGPQQCKLLLKKVQELTKALEHAHLKNVALETMIEVAEADLHIKIRKKRGTKQS
jgi:transposase